MGNCNGRPAMSRYALLSIHSIQPMPGIISFNGRPCPYTDTQMTVAFETPDALLLVRIVPLVVLFLLHHSSSRSVVDTWYPQALRYNWSRWVTTNEMPKSPAKVSMENHDRATKF
eukprot:37841-Prorocentrum_minimum.AAC.1